MHVQDIDVSEIKAVALDLDGTTLNKKHKLDPETIEVFDRLLAKGIQVYLSTGRPYRDVIGIKEDLHQKIPLITSNGGMINDSEIIEDYVSFVPESVVKTLSERTYPENIIINYYTRNRWFLNKVNEEIAEYFSTSHFTYEMLDLDKLKTDRIVKMFFIDQDVPPDPKFSSPYLNQLHDELVAEFGDKVEVVFSQVNCLEVNNLDVSKYSALKRVLGHQGYTTDKNLVAFGDGMNDKDMLKHAKYGFVMENADPRLKAYLAGRDNVIPVGYYYDKMVARVLNQIFNLEVPGLEPYFK